MVSDTDTTEPEPKTEALFFRVDEGTKARLVAIARREDRSLSSVVRRIISEHLRAEGPESEVA